VFFLYIVGADSSDTLIRKDTFIKSPTVAAWRSALLPGWGQFYNGSPIKGVVLGLITLGATSYTIYRYLDMRGEGTYSYQKTTNFLAALILNVAVWGYTVADAFVDAYLYGFKKEVETLKEDLNTSVKRDTTSLEPSSPSPPSR